MLLVIGVTPSGLAGAERVRGGAIQRRPDELPTSCGFRLDDIAWWLYSLFMELSCSWQPESVVRVQDPAR
jgi:hypothetical protein